MKFPRAAMAGLLVLLAAGGQAHAVTRIRADLTACADIQRTLRAEGSAIIRYPSKRIAGYFLYDRYLGSNAVCPWRQRLVATTVPAKDDPRCTVYRCEEVEPLFDLFDDRWN
ncbi:MAG: hypothetical protein WAU86_13720 [Oricola sp.]